VGEKGGHPRNEREGVTRATYRLGKKSSQKTRTEYEKENDGMFQRIPRRGGNCKSEWEGRGGDY